MAMSREEYLEDYYNEIDARKRGRCQCSREDFPGHCPGVDACPMARPDDEEPEEKENEE